MSKSPIDETIKGFIREVNRYIPSLEGDVQSLSADPGRKEAVENIHRLTHTIKGASAMVGVHGLSNVAYQMEEALEDVLYEELILTDELLRAMSRAIEIFREYCQGLVDGNLDVRALVVESVRVFRRARGLPPGEDDEAAREILDAIPASEWGESAGEEERLAEERSPTPGLPPELLENFYIEAEDHLEDLGRILGGVEAEVDAPETISPDRREALRQIRRSVHTLKGAASMVTLMEIAKWAHEVEDLLDWLYEVAGEITPDIVALLVESSDLLERLVTKPGEVDPSRADVLGERIRRLIGEEAGEEEAMAPLDGPGPEIDMSDILVSMDDEEEDDDDFPEFSFGEELEESDVDPDPLPGFFDERHKERRREERRKEPRVETPTRLSKTLRVDMERLEEMVNLAGELIIALSACDQKMDLFTNVLNEHDLSRDRLRKLAREMEVGYEVKAIHGMGDGGSPAPRDGESVDSGESGESGESEEFDALELDRYSEFNLLIRMLNESVVDVSAINSQLTNIHGDLDGYVNRLRILLSELQGKMMRIRMTPMAAVVVKLRQTLREAARGLGKEIRLSVAGEAIELDREVWEKITDPLMHLLRNAADHGIESPDHRRESGKPPMGAVKLAASREGAQVVIRVSDDGAGVDHDAIREKAREEGLSDRVDELTEDELTAFIFHPGFSTRGAVSETSGRGVGMDVVMENVRALKGSVKVASLKGKGTTFTIRIPLTMAVVNALLFTAGGREFAMGLNEISEIRRVRRDEIRTGPGETIRIGGEILRSFPLTRALNIRESEAGASEYPIILVIQAGGRRMALEIDALKGQRAIVVKSLGSHLQRVKGISGATIMGDGSVVPILDVEDFLGAGAVVSRTAIVDDDLMLEKHLEILVVDDSVSVRQVVTRFLEREGCRVRTARDGIEAMEKVREMKPDLIVLDIEMPRMNGYEFMAAIRSRPDARDVPIVILTSRTAKKHREKAISLGARGFVVKPYKEENFRNLIAELCGGGGER